jgi:osmotically-inducible protein OsmY
MRKQFMLTTVVLTMLGSTFLQCSAQEAGSDIQFPNAATPKISPQQNLMYAISENQLLSDDAKHISVTNINGSTVLTGFVKNDRERQLISHLAQEANCIDIVNKLKIKSANVQQNKQHIPKEKTIVVKNGELIVY